MQRHQLAINAEEKIRCRMEENKKHVMDMVVDQMISGSAMVGIYDKRR